jgi:hypothetical protein
MSAKISEDDHPHEQRTKARQESEITLSWNWNTEMNPSLIPLNRIKPKDAVITWLPPPRGRRRQSLNRSATGLKCRYLNLATSASGRKISARLARLAPDTSASVCRLKDRQSHEPLSLGSAECFAGCAQAAHWAEYLPIVW